MAEELWDRKVFFQEYQKNISENPEQTVIPLVESWGPPTKRTRLVHVQKFLQIPSLAWEKKDLRSFRGTDFGKRILLVSAQSLDTDQKKL